MRSGSTGLQPGAGATWRFITLAWALAIALLTLLPADRLPPTPAWRLVSFDTAAHAGVFAALALPLRMWWRAAGGRLAFWGTFTAALAYGAFIEWLQTALHWGRHGEWSDLLSDALGALLGAALAVWVPARWR